MRRWWVPRRVYAGLPCGAHQPLVAVARVPVSLAWTPPCEQCDEKSKKNSAACPSRSKSKCEGLKNVWGKAFCKAQMKDESEKKEAELTVRRTEPEAESNCKCESGGGGHFETHHWEEGCSCLRGDPC